MATDSPVSAMIAEITRANAAAGYVRSGGAEVVTASSAVDGSSLLRVRTCISAADLGRDPVCAIRLVNPCRDGAQ